MKRIWPLIGTFAFLFLLVGCGDHNAGVPEDKSNMPPEVKEYEEKREANLAKREADRLKKLGKSSNP